MIDLKSLFQWLNRHNITYRLYDHYWLSFEIQIEGLLPLFIGIDIDETGTVTIYRDKARPVRVFKDHGLNIQMCVLEIAGDYATNGVAAGAYVEIKRTLEHVVDDREIYHQVYEHSLLREAHAAGCVDTDYKETEVIPPEGSEIKPHTVISVFVL